MFVGDAEVAGYIYYDQEQMDEPIFTADKMSHAILPSFDYDLKLLDSEISNIKNFEFPKTSCWHTPATILVKKIEHIDDGSDNSGSYLRDYKILNLGKFIETCQYNTFFNEKK